MLRITPLFKASDRPAKVFGALEVNVVAVSETTHEVSPSVGCPSTSAGWIDIILPSRWCQKRSWDRHDQQAMENRASQGDVDSHCGKEVEGTRCSWVEQLSRALTALR